LAVEITKLDEFKKRLNEIVTEQINDEIAQPKIMVDSKIRLTEITPKFMRILDQFSPFGPGNMRPIFWASELEVAGKARAVGAGGKHLMMSVRQNGQKRVFDAIGFDLGEYAAELNSSGCMFDMLFSLEQKIIDKKEFPQLRIRDLHFNKRSGV
jgi:single-stranded-DNA-specific exonuclease